MRDPYPPKLSTTWIRVKRGISRARLIASCRRRSISAISCSIGLSHASQVAWTILVEAADRGYDPQIEHMTIVSKSPRDWINENVKQLDAPVLNMGDVRTRDGHRAMGRARPPEESCSAIVAHSMPGRGEDEIWR